MDSYNSITFTTTPSFMEKNCDIKKSQIYFILFQFLFRGSWATLGGAQGSILVPQNQTRASWMQGFITCVISPALFYIFPSFLNVWFIKIQPNLGRE